MFHLDEVPPAPYQDPWGLPLDHRLETLQSRKRRVAYFYDRADNSTFRYRVYNPVQVLNALGEDVSAAYFFSADQPFFAQIADSADLLVMCRTKYNEVINSIATLFRNRGKPVIYDIDDLVFDVEHAHLIARTIHLDMREDSAWTNWFGYVARCGMAMKLCDGCITTNDFLAERIRQFSGKPVKVLPNFVNREQLEMSDRVWRVKAADGFRGDGHVGLGYFSGTPTHRHDFAIAWPAIAAVMHAHPRVTLTLAGYMEIDGLDPALRDRVRRLPFMDYVNLQRAVGEVELNVVPLQNNLFTHCKSDLKYFEAALVGTISIASPVHTYASHIEHGVNGYLCRSHEWQPVLEQAIGDHERYGTMARAARADAEARHAWDRRLGEVLASLDWR